MPRIAYEPMTMRGPALEIVRQAEGICREYVSNGYDLTLRQIYYQFVGRGLTAEWATGANTERSYKRLGAIIDNARMQGMLDWYYITDRTRHLSGNSHWDTPADIINSAAHGYTIDKWADQATRVEVWVEKEALAGVIGRVATDRDVDYFACRGYVSQSEMWRAGRRLAGYIEDGRNVVVLHLGDHDPSGIDMTRDIRDRLRTFAAGDVGGSRAYDMLEVRRIALTMDQIEQYDPPPNPAKLSDSRGAGYIDRYGSSSWELDALPPDVLADLINEHIDREIDQDAYNARHAEESADRDRLTLAADNWREVAVYVDHEFGADSDDY